MTRGRRRPRRPLPVAATPGARLVVAAESGHYVQIDQPELVIDAIRQVVEAVREPADWATPAASSSPAA